MSSFDQIKLVKTADGSPSIEMKQGEAPIEWMHHSQGAFSETNYLYRPIIELALWQKMSDPRLLSVGIGLGYNEIFTAALALRNGDVTYKIWSYEKNDELRNSFLNFITSRPESYSSPTKGELFSAYNWIIKKTATEFELSAEDIRTHLTKMFDRGDWTVHANFSLEDHSLSGLTGLLYDPFSKKVNPDLWQTDRLEEFLVATTNEVCFLGSYASNSNLKNALIKCKFNLFNRLGFSGKRNCTLAFRPFHLEDKVKSLIDSWGLADS